MLTRIEIPPGVVSDSTHYAAGNRWVASDGVRFFDNQPERIGGNILHQTAVAADSDIHALTVWGTYAGTVLTGYGCETAYYVSDGQTVWDTTPYEYTYTNPNIYATLGFAAFQLSTDGVHTPIVGSFMTISGCPATGGIPANEINGIREVLSVTSGIMTFAATTVATSSFSGAAPTATVAARASFVSTLIGGSLGFGLGGYGGAAAGGVGSFGYGGANAAIAGTDGLYLWSQDIFGEWLVYNPRGGPIYVWSPTAPTTRAQTLAQLGAIDEPEFASFVLMADRSRQLIVLGTNDTDSSVFDPMLVRWSDVEDLTAWTPTLTNQAGSLRLTDGSSIIAGVRTRQDILIFTDTALYALSYIGAPEVFALRPLATNVSVLGPDAIVADDDVVYWMAADGFYRFDGRVMRIPCPITRQVKTSLRADVFKMATVAGLNKAFQEIWFSFATTGSAQQAMTVIFNTASGTWSTLSFGRSAWTTGGLVGGPIAARGRYCVRQEVGEVDFSTGVSEPITSFIQSGALELTDQSGAGNNFAFITKLIPDITLPTDTSQATFTITTRHDAGSNDATNSSPSGTVTQTVTAFTPQLDIRCRGRQFAIRIAGVASALWKLGVPRVLVKQDGQR